MERATPFQSPDWLIPWWRHLGSGELRAVALYCGNKLTGLLPLYSETGGNGSLLRFLGTGISDYLDCIFGGSARDIEGGLYFAAQFLAEMCASRCELQAADRMNFELVLNRQDRSNGPGGS
jgi:CelD/BcsL family acetyltransferase involved in cellulose biosynthesis